MRKSVVFKSSLATLACMAMLSTPTLADALRPVDIPAGDLRQALLQASQHFNAEIVYSPEQVRGLKTGGVHGALTAEQAIIELLRGTTLELRTDPSGAMLIARAGVAPTSANEQAASTRVHLAQLSGDAAVGAQRSTASAPGTAGAQSLRERPEVEEVVVTGTNIRGLDNPTAPVRSFDREYIRRRGYETTQGFINSLPQNFRGGATGATEDGAVGSAIFGQSNQEAASGVNLRGLGTSSTLVLLNGRRMAPAAFGGVTDISVIPLSAVERIDVLTDGSSAIYGGDAVAGVVNFVLRRDFDGAETEASYGGVTSGSLRTTTVAQTLGTVWNDGGMAATLQYQDHTALPSAQREFTKHTPQPTDLTPHTTKYSGLLTGHHQLTALVDVFADALVSFQDLQRDARQSKQSLQQYRIESLQQSYNAGAGIQAFSDWRLELRASYGRQTTDSYFDAYEPALPGYTPGTRASGNTAEVGSIELNGDGSLFELPGGTVRMALGGGVRHENFESLVTWMFDDSLRLRRAERDVSSLYDELNVPVVGRANAKPWMRALDLSLAVRWDDYSDFGSTTNPKVGLRWSPIEGLSVHASWSTSFRAPIANETMNQSLPSNVLNYVLPGTSGGTERVFLISGVDPELGPEKSRNWTVGFELRPERLPGLTLSLDYYRIRFTNRIDQAPLDATALQQPEFYGSLLTRLADDASAARFLADMVARGVIFDDIFGFGSEGVRYALDLRLKNAAFVDQSGIDALLAYQFDHADNRFDLSLSGSYIKEIRTGLTSQSVAADIVDTYSNPLSLRLRGDIGWSRGAWRANMALNYRTGYTDTSISPTASVGAWTTVDFSVGWRFGAEGHDMALALNLLNAFDRAPPYVFGAGLQPDIHYDVGNADPYGRTISLQLRKLW